MYHSLVKGFSLLVDYWPWPYWGALLRWSAPIRFNACKSKGWYIFPLCCVAWLLYAVPIAGLAQTSSRGLAQANVYSVLDFETPRNQYVNAEPYIQRAIDSCAAGGGGVVFFPAGDYYSATIRMRSHVELHFSRGATLHAIPDETLYRNDKAGLEHSGEAITPVLILARNVSHIAITGLGRIKGAPAFGMQTVTDQDTYPGWNETARRAGVAMEKPMVQPPKVSLVYLTGCQDVVLTDVSILDSPNWSCHLQWCRQVRVRSLVITSSLEKGVNSDGLDIDGCSDVIVSDCIIRTGDDAICLKSTRQAGRSEPCRDIIVTNCILSSSSCAFKIGTETHADFTRIRVANCIIKESNRGLGIIVRDGSLVSDVDFDNILIDCQRKSFFWWGNGEAFHFVVIKRSTDSKIGRIKRLRLLNIVATTEGTSVIQGYDQQSIDDIDLSVIRMTMNPESQPDRRMTHAVTIEQATNVRIKDCEIKWNSAFRQDHHRHALSVSTVGKAQISGLTCDPATQSQTIRLQNITDSSVMVPPFVTDITKYLLITGNQTNRVVIETTRHTPQKVRLLIPYALKGRVLIH